MKKYVIAGGAVILLLLLLFRLHHHQVALVADNTAPVLKENEHEKVVIDFGAKTIVDVHRGEPYRGTGTAPGTLPFVRHLGGVRHATVTITKDPITHQEEIKVWAQTSGFIFEPGVVAALDDGPKLGIDTKIYFQRRLGLNVGLLTDSRWRVRAYVAGSYTVYQNTSLFVGIDNKKEIVLGVRVGF